MTSNMANWPALSFLEGIRPGPDEEVELALLASYSADLGTIGAVLLALAGKDNDAGGGNASDFADAVERLRGKVRIIIQRGRLARTRKTPRIAAVLDQFVREVDFDEAHHSWHPKAALVRTRQAEEPPKWRLWIGSRNLTECVNRDIGLLLVSGGSGAKPVPGADLLARSLAERAALRDHSASVVQRVIARTVWRAPAGVTVEQIRWSSGEARTDAPAPPSGTDEIVMVSPFVDKTFLSRQAGTQQHPALRTLLTTMREIDRVGPGLGHFDQLCALDAPEYPSGDPEPEAGSDTADTKDDRAADEEEEIGRGLHAKMLFWRVGKKRTLWLGSANATMRGWTGRNAEVTAQLTVTESVEAGLRALLGSAYLVSPPTEEQVVDAAAREEEALEIARAQVAARWGATLEADGEELFIVQASDRHGDGPHPKDGSFTLEIAALHGELRGWARGAARVSLGPVIAAERSEFVRLRISRGDKGLSWLQRAPADPPFGEDRDRAAFVRFLGTRGFLLWLAGQLAGDGRDSEGDWTIEKVERLRSNHEPTLDPELPTMEEMLSAWSRDKDKFGDIERRVSDYLPAVLEQARQEDAASLALLREFEQLWTQLRIGLGLDLSRRRK